MSYLTSIKAWYAINKERKAKNLTLHSFPWPLTHYRNVSEYKKLLTNFTKDVK